MTALSEEEKREMITATREIAWAAVEDIEYVRNIVTKSDPTPRDVRHSSNILRRLLIDNGGDLRKISPPRLDRRLRLTAPDIGPLIKAGEKEPWPFMSAGLADVFGITIDAWSVNPGNQARPIEGYEPGKTIELPLDNFLAQKVVCFEGEWITRADTVKYIANVALGVHAGSPREPKHELLKKIRYIATIKFGVPPGSVSSGAPVQMPIMTFNPNAISNDDKAIAVDRQALDFVLIQLMSTGRYLTISPDIQELEVVIKHEQRP
jgi:hypothetical protein